MIVSLNVRIEGMAAELEQAGEARNVANADNSELYEKIASQEEELYGQKQVSIELLEQLKDLEFQLQQAQAKIAELLTQIEYLEKHQAIYIAKKNDKVDKVLANYIN